MSAIVERASAPRTRISASGVLAAVPIALVVLLVAWPVANVFVFGLRSASLETLADASTWRVMAYTIAQAAASTAATIALALPAAYALHRLRVPGRRIALIVLTVAFVLPTVVVGLAFRQLLPFPGTTAAIVVAHVFFNVGLVTRIVGGVWENIDPRLADVGATLGLSPVRVFTRITLPALAPAIAASAVLVFLFTFTSFGVVLVLGDPALPTIEVDIYNLAMRQLDLAGASALALLQLIVVVAALAAGSYLQRRSSVHRQTAAPTLRAPHGWVDRACMIFSWLLAAAVAAPLAVLIVRSLRVGSTWGLGWYAEILVPTDRTTRAVPAAESLLVSARYALVATAIALALGMAASAAIAYRHRRAVVMDTIVGLPLGVSAVTVGFGLLLASLYGPVDMRGWWILVPLGQALVAMPLVVRMVVPLLASVDPRLRDVAATLGRPPVRAWLSTDGAIAGRATAIAAAFACAVSLGEFGATAFLVRADAPTIPIQIVRLLGRPGEANIGQANALSVVLLLLVVAILAVIEVLQRRQAGAAA